MAVIWLNESESVVRFWSGAIALGSKDREMAKPDIDFDSLRNDPAFQALLKA
ncbi:MAG: hypothetical protein Fur0046_15900 [Cyanobacteria bacterium J069]